MLDPIRKWYYLSYLRNRIFPFEINQIKLSNIESNSHYHRIINACPTKPKPSELTFLIKYKMFVDDKRTYSMASKQKVDQMEKLVKTVCSDRIPGSIVETGVWKGGMAMWIKSILKYYHSDKKIWLFDVFDRFPEPVDQTDKYIHPITSILFENAPTIQSVRDNFIHFNLYNNINLVKGLFEHTLEITDTGSIAILHLDSDYYDSTLYVLRKMYDRISIGGYVVIDDYGNNWLACKKAVDEFRLERSITDKLFDLGSESVYWKKSR